MKLKGDIAMCIFTYAFYVFVLYTGYLEKLTPHLRDVYERTRFVPKQNLWPPNQPKLFKNLTFLRHDSQFKQQQLSHIPARYRHAIKHCPTNELNVGVNAPMFKALEQVHLSICKSNATKNIGDLFSYEEGFKPRSILVEGAPGVGKTELIKEITFLWAKEKLLCDMKVVFLLYLREPSIHTLKSIDNFIHHYINHGDRYLSTKDAEGVIQELRDSRGSGIAIVMDGFDEFPSRVYNNSFVAGLISGEVLPNALLLITSRPSSSLFLHGPVDRIFDIVGFAKEEKEQYIADSLKDVTKQNELNQYLNQYPIINSYCYIPLYLAMVIFLLKRTSLPETLTRMNELFILQTINRNLQQRNKQYKKLSLNKLSDLPIKVLKIILRLSKLAYDGVQESKLVFTLEEIRQVSPETDDILSTMNDLGLLQAVQHYNPLAVTEETASFNFLHYSMQEYLAAYYISTLSDADQYSIMISFKPLHYALSAAQRESTSVSCFWHNDFIFMWLMYVGITCGQAHAFILLLGNSGFFPTTGKASNNPIRPLNIMEILHVFQCFVEANNVKACNVMSEFLFRDRNICIIGAAPSIVPLFSHHMLSLVFFLTKSSRSYKSLKFANCFFLDDAMNTLEDYFLKHPKKASSIKTIQFENSSFVSNSGILGTIIKGGHISNISIVNIGNCDISNMISSLVGNRNLETLTIQQMGFNDENIKLLIQHLSGNKLKVLNITKNLCTSSGMKSIANFMGKKSTLLALTVSENMVGVSKEVMPILAKHIIPANFLQLYNDKAGLEALASALKKNPPLRSLNLSNNCILFVKELAFALHCNRALMSLDLSRNFLNCDDQSSYNELGNVLRTNNALKSLNISHNDISEVKMQSVIYALYYNKTLQSLDMSGNGLGSKIIEDLAHALKYNDCLCLLALGCNSIGDEGAIHLSAALKLNKTITSLYLRDNMITNVGAVEIATALRDNKVLKELDMSMNDISDEGVSALCKMFFIETTLKVLFLVFNPINTEEAVKKFASKDAKYYCQNHVPVTNYVYAQSVTQIKNRDKKVEYSQKLPVQTTANCNIWYGLTTDKRTLTYTPNAFYECWKNHSFNNIFLLYMYAHASIHYQNEALEEECLQCYTHTLFNSL